MTTITAYPITQGTLEVLLIKFAVELGLTETDQIQKLLDLESRIKEEIIEPHHNQLIAAIDEIESLEKKVTELEDEIERLNDGEDFFDISDFIDMKRYGRNASY